MIGKDIREYITDKTTASSNFIVHKLVKKGRDIAELNFVSFKIAVTSTDFDILNDPDVWPQHVLVREFVEVKPLSFGDFLPRKDAPTATKPPTPGKSPEKMDLTEKSPSNTTIQTANAN